MQPGPHRDGILKLEDDKRNDGVRPDDLGGHRTDNVEHPLVLAVGLAICGEKKRADGSANICYS